MTGTTTVQHDEFLPDVGMTRSEWEQLVLQQLDECSSGMGHMSVLLDGLDRGMVRVALITEDILRGLRGAGGCE